jgi:hypothetical protein
MHFYNLLQNVLLYLHEVPTGHLKKIWMPPPPHLTHAVFLRFFDTWNVARY